MKEAETHRDEVMYDEAMTNFAVMRHTLAARTPSGDSYLFSHIGKEHFQLQKDQSPVDRSNQ